MRGFDKCQNSNVVSCTDFLVMVFDDNRSFVHVAAMIYGTRIKWFEFILPNASSYPTH